MPFIYTSRLWMSGVRAAERRVLISRSLTGERSMAERYSAFPTFDQSTHLPNFFFKI